MSALRCIAVLEAESIAFILASSVIPQLSPDYSDYCADAVVSCRTVRHKETARVASIPCRYCLSSPVSPEVFEVADIGEVEELQAALPYLDQTRAKR